MNSFTWLLFVKQHLNCLSTLNAFDLNISKHWDLILAPFISSLLNEIGQIFLSFYIKMLYNGLLVIWLRYNVLSSNKPLMSRNRRSVINYGTPPQLQKFERSASESAKYGKNPFRTVGAVERIWDDVPYHSSFIANSWLNDLKDTGQVQKSLHATQTLIRVIVLSNIERIYPSCRTRQDGTHLEFVLASRGYMTLKI